MTSASVMDLKAFVPAKDYALAKQFYVDLGFNMNWGNNDIAEFEAGAYRFLLQNYYVKAFAESFMMHLSVGDVDLWWQHIEASRLVATYPGIMAKPPAVQPWGLRVLFLSDPTRVLWHIADSRIA